MNPAQQDFRVFLHIVWKALGLPKPTRRQLAIAWFLQHGPRRSVIMAFRGVGKSWLTAAFVVWLLYVNPQTKILVVSASKTRADNFTTFCLQLINMMPELAHLRSREDQRCSRVMFDVGPANPDQQPSVMSLGITSALAGNRADYIIPDDIEVLNNSATQLMREKLSEAVKEFDAILKPGGHIKFLGTPQCEDTVYETLADRGYEIRIWPARYPNQQEQLMYGPRLAPDVADELSKDPNLVGRTTEPLRFTDMDLAERETSYGRAGFALQYMLNTRLSDADRFPIKTKDMIFMSLSHDVGPDRVVWTNDPDRRVPEVNNVALRGDAQYEGIVPERTEFRPWEDVIMAIDPSGRGKDETAYAILARLNGRLFLLDAGGFIDGFSTYTLEALAKLTVQWGVKLCIPEPNYGGGMWTNLFLPVLKRVNPRCGLQEAETSRGNKEMRICDTLEPVVQQHRLVVNKALLHKDWASVGQFPTEVAYQYRLFYQLTRIYREKAALAHDDRVDALAIGVAHFTDAMALDPVKAEEANRARDLEKEIKRIKARSERRSNPHAQTGPVWSRRP